MSQPVLVVGSSGLDTVETPAASADNVLGGSAIYFAAAASLFTPVQLVSVVGDDFPDSGRDALSSHNIDLDGLEVVSGGKTFRWHGRYSADMNDRETVSVELNVLGSFAPKLPDSYKDTKYVFLANGPTATQHAVMDQMNGTPYAAADTMNLWIETELEGLTSLLKRVDLLVLNDGEARMLTDIGSLWDAAEKILQMGPRTVALKKGEHGSYLVGVGGRCAVPAYPIDSLVDPTGAGDSFAGGFMGYVAQQDDTGPETLRRAMAAGSAVASFACESIGPDRLLSVTQDELASRIEALSELVRF